MASEYDKSISRLKENLDKAKGLKIRAEARLEQLNKQKQDILKEIEEMGVKPEELEDEIDRLKAEIEDMIRKVGKMLPEDIL